MLPDRRLSWATALLMVCLCRADEVYNRYNYCVKYYGSVSAELNLEGLVPQYNYNGTIRCPDIFDFPSATSYLAGATLEICPPLSYTDDIPVLDVQLSFSDSSGVLSGPIDNLDLHGILITNGSVTEPFENGGIPALLQFDPAQSEPFLPVWTVNGTEAALTEAPTESDNSMGVYFDCDYPGSRYYCGGYEDIHEGGCWSRQSFYFNMRSRLNFTIRFSENEATFEIWAQQELLNYEGASTSNYTKAYLRFGGDRSLPSIVDYDFWEHSTSDYEVEQQFLSTRQDLEWTADENGMPLLSNDTDSGEWYDAGNGTFKAENSAQHANGFRMGMPVVAALMMASAAFIL